VIGDLLIALGMVASAAILAGTGLKITERAMRPRGGLPPPVIKAPEKRKVFPKKPEDPGPPRRVEPRPSPVGAVRIEAPDEDTIRWAPGPEMIPPVQGGRR
jgi:hypothetical protein